MKLTQLLEYASKKTSRSVAPLSPKATEKRDAAKLEKFEKLKSILGDDYSDALDKFRDDVKICRMSNSTYDWRIIEEPRERRRIQGSKDLGFLYNWFAVENNLPLRTEATFGFTKSNHYANNGVFGDHRYYIIPKNGTKLICLRKDFNDSDSGVYHDVEECLQHYLKDVKRSKKTDDFFADLMNESFAPAILFKELIVPMGEMLKSNFDPSSPHDVAKAISAMRTTDFGDDEVDVIDEEHVALRALVYSGALPKLFDDIEAILENAIDVKNPKTVDKNYQEVFTNDKCIVVYGSFMESFMKWLDGE